MNYLKYLINIYKYLNIKNNIINKESIILAEFNPNLFPLIGIIFLLKILNKIHKCRILVYFPKNSKNSIDLLKTIIKILFRFKTLLIYLVHGATPHIIISSTATKSLAKLKFDKIICNINTKDDLLNLKLENIEVGDLFYDNYTRFNASHTIEVNEKFRQVLFEYFIEFYYWFNFFNKFDIKSVLTSHAVYNLAIPLRIAQSKKIPGYIASINFIEYFDISRKNIFQSSYRNSFKFLNNEEKKKALSLSKMLLEDRFKGILNSSEFSGYGSNHDKRKNLSKKALNTFGKKNTIKKIFKKNGKPNILIMAHCFYDAPHGGGKFLFVDFYEWVKHLGELSNKLDFNWYIKKHPHSAEQVLNNKVIENILAIYPNLNLLDEGVSNNEIINDGVSLILTVHGSAGYEFSYHSIPVILASNQTAYENYDICYQPSSVKEYDDIIKNFSKINFSYNKKEIYRYYYNIYLAFWELIPMQEYYKIKNIVKDEYNFRMNFLSQENALLKYLRSEFTEKKISEKLLEVENFIKKNDYRIISRNNINKEFEVDKN